MTVMVGAVEEKRVKETRLERRAARQRKTVAIVEAA